jgi:hypothetical protein
MTVEPDQEYHSPTEQLRKEIGGYDIRPGEVGQFTERLKNMGFQELSPIGGSSGYATVYMLAQSPAVEDNRFRYRIYCLNEDRLNNFCLQPEDVGVLELKSKHQRYPDRIEHKYRQTTTADFVDRVIKNPGAANVILNSAKSENMPPNYPNGIIPREALKDLFETVRGGYLYPSLVIVSKRRHFVADPNNFDALRVTVDQDTQYYGYDPQSQNPSIFIVPDKIGPYPLSRVEIKLDRDDLAETGLKVKDNLEKIGERPLVRKAGFQAYFQYFYQSRDIKALQPIAMTNEVPGYEIEAKLNIISDTKVDRVASLIYEFFNGEDQDFEIHQGLEIIKESYTHAARYGYTDKGGRLKEAFVITDRPERRWVGIKRKKNVFDHNLILVRKESRETLERWPEWTRFAEEMVIKEEAVRLQIEADDIVKIGSSKRRKLFVYIRNKKTDRGYIVSIDQSISDQNGSERKQVEIEYGIRSGIQPVYGLGIVPVIEEDIDLIRKKIIAITQKNGITLEPTVETKFDWLNSIKNN